MSDPFTAWTKEDRSSLVAQTIKNLPAMQEKPMDRGAWRATVHGVAKS